MQVDILLKTIENQDSINVISVEDLRHIILIINVSRIDVMEYWMK